jgi:hypothetical protein
VLHETTAFVQCALFQAQQVGDSALWQTTNGILWIYSKPEQTRGIVRSERAGGVRVPHGWATLVLSRTTLTLSVDHYVKVADFLSCVHGGWALTACNLSTSCFGPSSGVNRSSAIDMMRGECSSKEITVQRKMLVDLYKEMQGKDT